MLVNILIFVEMGDDKILPNLNDRTKHEHFSQHFHKLNIY